MSRSYRLISKNSVLDGFKYGRLDVSSSVGIWKPGYPIEEGHLGHEACT